MKRFDPFSDRMARDIRNTLSEALIKELSGNSEQSLDQTLQQWLAKDLQTVYRSYIDKRQKQYQSVLKTITSEKIKDPRFQAIVLWNKELFFELHELLETIWIPAAEPERSGIKGLIQAAGVYVHLYRGKLTSARKLAKRARQHLAANTQSLRFINNLSELIRSLENPSLPAPVLLAKYIS